MINLKEVNVLASLLEVLLGFLEAELVTLFKISIVLLIQLLHGVVGQVNERLVDRLLAERELLRARTDVSLSEHVAALV